ncbi:hypothetical protein [Oceanobacillus halotolerans]|uniref:hypothetical protein n=1 Tax=Oceanobacillus halotolerans TaxID=2663380 RepID=UPI0013D9FC6E|nr:hypothetical protein [Oceanobacillus halotolerans]
MAMRINIKNININSIATLGSLNIGKAIFAKNRSSSVTMPKENYEETNATDEQIKEMVPQLPQQPEEK